MKFLYLEFWLKIDFKILTKFLFLEQTKAAEAKPEKKSESAPPADVPKPAAKKTEKPKPTQHKKSF